MSNKHKEIPLDLSKVAPVQIVKNGKIVTRRANGTKRVVTINDQPSRTQKQFRDKVNVNSIMAKYRKTGLIDHVRQTPGVYTDLTRLPDYQTAMETVVRAQETFQTVPANIRLKFDNDPAKFIAFLDDDKNYDEAVKLGLIIPKEQQTPAPVEPSPQKNKPSEKPQEPPKS